MIPSEAIEVRKFIQSTDEAFLYSTWLRNYKYSSYFAKRVKPSVFFAGHHKILNHIMAKPTTIVLIAYPKDDSDTILGYLVYEDSERPVIHFTFVKEAFRKMGVLRRLIEAANIDPTRLSFSHWTFPVDELIRKYPEIVYDPYCL